MSAVTSPCRARFLPTGSRRRRGPASRGGKRDEWHRWWHWWPYRLRGSGEHPARRLHHGVGWGGWARGRGGPPRGRRERGGGGGGGGGSGGGRWGNASAGGSLRGAGGAGARR